MHIPPKSESDTARLSGTARGPSVVVVANALQATTSPGPATVASSTNNLTEDWKGGSSSRKLTSPPLSRRRLQCFLGLAAFLGLAIGCVVAGSAAYFSGVIEGKRQINTASGGGGATPSPAPSSAPNPYSDVTIFTNTQSFDDLDQVILTFLGLPEDAMVGAWIGLFRAENLNTSAIAPLPWPATPPWTATAPIQWVMVETLSMPQGLFPVQLVNAFEPYVFCAFSNGISSPKLIACSQTIQPKSSPPLRGRLSRSQDDATEVRLTWHSAVANGTPKVYYGPTSMPNYPSGGSNYSSFAYAQCYTYTPSQMATEPAKSVGWLDPHYFCSATLSGLTPGSRYYYRYGSATTGISQEETFLAPISPGSGLVATNGVPPVRWLLYGDSGLGVHDIMTVHWSEDFASLTTARIQTAITASITAGQPYTGALHIGDLAYGTGYASKWMQFEALFHARIGAQMPVSVVYGNHERASPGSGSIFGTNDSGGEAGIPMAIRFPSPGFNGNDPAAFAAAGYYAIREGPAAFLFFNSELPMGPDSAQYLWAESWLSLSFDRTVTPWLFFVWHRPMYLPSGPMPPMQAIEPLLLRWQVDAVLNGHVHDAFVTGGVYNNTVLTGATTPAVPLADGWDGTRHFIVGNAGQNLYPIPDPEDTAPYIDWQAAEYGFSDLTIVDATRATIRFMAASADNVVLHSVTMTRTYPRLPVPA